ncbi:hypothetical protein JK636_02740 [Clostridium sp. YIM B02515]|uniref:Uncharacterized protein n=2 Tax=Clostridium rhizosphaerae TaxID=2803861 RepID=A0ABS1T5S0_9CLOT|nr:hypothetical protein [Clostridium rhizosphaerae]
MVAEPVTPHNPAQRISSVVVVDVRVVLVVDLVVVVVDLVVVVVDAVLVVVDLVVVVVDLVVVVVDAVLVVVDLVVVVVDVVVVVVDAVVVVVLLEVLKKSSISSSSNSSIISFLIIALKTFSTALSILSNSSIPGFFTACPGKIPRIDLILLASLFIKSARLSSSAAIAARRSLTISSVLGICCGIKLLLFE